MALSPTRCRSPTLPRLPLDSSMAITRYNGRGRIGPSFRGKLYEYESNGRRIIASWPKPRGKPVSEKQALSQKAFKEVAEAVKRTAAEIQNFHRLAAAGTPMLPRDTLFAALYGNGPAIKLYDGRIIKPMANKYLASTVLDAIGWAKGDLLYRGPDQWEVLPLGKPGYVLTLPNDGGVPRWAPPTSGGSYGRILNGGLRGNTSSSFSTNGVAFTTKEDFVIEEVRFIPAAHIAASGRFIISIMPSASTLGTIVVDEVVDMSGAVAGSLFTHKLNLPFKISAHQRAFIGFIFTAGTSTTRQTFVNGGSQFYNLITETVSGYRLAAAAAAGSLLSVSSDAMVFIEIIGGSE